MNQGQKLISNFKFYSGNYSFYREDKKRYESWPEAISERVMPMHRRRYSKQLSESKKLREYVDFAEKAYLDKLVLGSQRALQFGGKDIEKHESKMYNCLTSYADRPEFFSEAMYWLLSGCGIGFRVLPKDVDKMPDIIERSKGVKKFVVEDSIEGWSDAMDVIVSSFMDEKSASRPEYSGYFVDFDYSKIRPKGALISNRFKAPGPEGLKNAMVKITELIYDRYIQCKNLSIDYRLRTVDVYDIVMHMSNAVLSGGVRRSATICLFHHQDLDMLNAKTHENFRPYGDNPLNAQRARSNNSAMLIRNEVSKVEFAQLMKSVKDWGEPGFVWTDNYDIIFNPCVEIGMFPQYNGVSGWQGCNLTEINGGMCDTIEKFLRACKASAILGTLQAGYTSFKYVGDVCKKIFERESLLGCSITGFANNPSILLDPKIQRMGAELIKEINKEVAILIGINPAARTTCVKPAGNTSILLETASGIHGEHSPLYFRQVQVNKSEVIPDMIRKSNPEMFEESVWSENKTDWVMTFPIETKEGSIYKDELLGVKQLELVKLTQQNWVEAGTNPELCAVENIRHNVSNTIQVDDWDEVEDYIYDNRQWFAGISLLSNMGDKDYAQAPFVAVYEPEQILDLYGVSSMFASGLIVDALHAFNNNLWNACASGLGQSLQLEENSENALKIDWIRRFKKFAKTYHEGDLHRTTYLLKDVYNYHKWVKLSKNVIDLDWENLDIKPTHIEIDTMGSAACAGGACEVEF